MSFLLLRSAAAVGRVPQRLSVRSAVAVGLLLCLLRASCDVRPFSDFADGDSTEDTDGSSDGGETPAPEEPVDLDLSATPPNIDTEVDVEEIVEVSIGARDPERTYTFEITTEPANGTAVIDPDTGRLTFTSDTPVESDSLTVTVTETAGDVTTFTDTIDIPITVVGPE